MPTSEGAAIPSQQQVIKRQVQSHDPLRAVDFLALHGGLSKRIVKDAMNKGAVWLSTGRGPRRRLRRASAELHTGDRLELFYDAALLALQPGPAECLADRGGYSVWYKPPGMLAQGTDYGDHCSLLRVAELQLGRPCLPVHRLDREAFGLMLVAHRQADAARLSRLLQQGQVHKEYRIEVYGEMKDITPHRGRIEIPLDGKSAITEYQVESTDTVRATSVVRVTLLTGRLHQIRRHFDLLGFPVMGDPRYGRGNKSVLGLRLAAVSIVIASWRDSADETFVLPQRYLEY